MNELVVEPYVKHTGLVLFDHIVGKVRGVCGIGYDQPGFDETVNEHLLCEACYQWALGCESAHLSPAFTATIIRGGRAVDLADTMREEIARLRDMVMNVEPHRRATAQSRWESVLSKLETAQMLANMRLTA